MSEIWKPIKDFENIYEISNLGRIRNIQTNTLEELLEIRNELAQAWIIQRNEYQVKQLKKVNYEIEKRNK